MSKPFRIYLLAAGLLIAFLTYHFEGHRQAPSIQTSHAAPATPGESSAVVARSSNGPAAEGRALWLRPDQVLATVNGQPIKLAEVVPVDTNNNQGEIEVSVQALKYLLKRAVDRDLVFQTAKDRGLTLNDSQYQQLANLRSMRNLPEPGGIAKLNSSAAQGNLELQDAQAFMLQTSLLAAEGASPDVTESQVEAYYLQHRSQFGDLPVDDAARARAWAGIAYEIRQQLAATTRANYNEQVAAYMKQMESSANIVLTALDQPLNTE
jgi:hypothetical protein